MSNENGVGPMPDMNAEMERASRVLRFAEAELEQKQKHIVKLTEIISVKNEEIRRHDDSLAHAMCELQESLERKGIKRSERSKIIAELLGVNGEEIDGLRRCIDKLKAALLKRGVSEQEYLDIRMGRAK